jgi:CRP/FNR family transcriptional regulator, cyclic AMP receptor protein
LSEEHASLFARIGLFEPFSSEEIGQIALGILAKSFVAGQHILTPAYHGEILFLLLEGQVRIYRMEAGREATIGILEAGEMFGEAAFTTREYGGHYAQAMAASTKVAFLTRSSLYRLIRREPALGIRAVELLSERLSFYEKRIADMALKEVRGRVASVILELSKQEGIISGEGRNRIPTNYSHEDLATMVGASRLSVSRAMKELRKAKAVGSARQRIVVEDAVALERIAREAS